jgi:hypothetical protein
MIQKDTNKKVLVLHPDFHVHDSIAASGSVALFDPKEFYQTAQEIIIPLNHYINTCSQEYSSSIDWWVSSIGCRNPFQSHALLSVSYLFYLKKLLDKNIPIDKIVVFNRGLKEAIARNFNDRISGIEIVCLDPKGGPKQSLYHFLQSIHFLLAGLKRHIFALRSGRRSEIKTPVNLIDIFIFKNSFASGKFHDRYFGDFVARTSSKHWVYLASFAENSDHLANFRAMRKQQASFLIKEDYLKLNDYLFAIGHPRRLRKILKPFPDFQGITIDPILNDDINRNLTKTSLSALLDYRLAFRLKETGVSIKLLWDWYENQNIDKALIAGIRKCFGKAPKIIGYEGYLPSSYVANAAPTVEEEKAGIIPDIIAVMSKYQEEGIKTYNPGLTITHAPAFRYTHLFNNNAPIMTQKKSILIALPILVDKSLEIINLCSKLDPQLFTSVDFLVKPHPATKKDLIENFIASRAFKNAAITEKTTEELLQKNSIVVCNSSSIAFEAMSLGIPIVILASQTQIDNNVIPTNADARLWSHCFNPKEFQEALLKFLSYSEVERKSLQKVGQGVRDYFFNAYDARAENILNDLLQ